MDKSNIQKEIAELYTAMHNNGKIQTGCAIVLPKAKYTEYLESLGLAEADTKKISFLSVPVLKSNSDSQEIIFLESAFGELDGLGTEQGVDIHKAVANVFRNKIEEMKKSLINKLELDGIVFQDDEAFAEFAKTQLVYKTEDDCDVILYEGKEYMRINNKFQPKPQKDND